MTLWELSACIQAWRIANGAEERPVAPSADEFYAMVERLG
jgi:hypothetical protein